jgi:multidrug efflux pump subunit AcrA (membrane-fusion protein)
MNKRAVIAFVIILLGSALLFAQNAARQRPAVQVEQVYREMVYDTVKYGARIEPQTITSQKAPFAGTITNIYVTEGQTVWNGTALYSITRTSLGSTGDFVPMTVYAVARGTVLTIPVKRGDDVSDKAEILTTADLRFLKTVINVSDKDIALFKRGLECTVQGSETVGKIQKIAIVPNVQSGLFPVDVEFPDITGLFTGRFVTMEFKVNPMEGIFVPGNSIVSRYGKQFVYLISDSTAEMAEIVVLKMSGSRALVSGIEPGDVVAVSNTRMLMPGMEVNVIPPTSTPQ